MTTKAAVLGTIRGHCLKCCSNSWKDVETCPAGPDAPKSMQCALWPYRFGKDPNPSKKRQEAGKVRAQENFGKVEESA